MFLARSSYACIRNIAHFTRARQGCGNQISEYSGATFGREKCDFPCGVSFKMLNYLIEFSDYLTACAIICRYFTVLSRYLLEKMMKVPTVGAYTCQTSLIAVGRWCRWPRRNVSGSGIAFRSDIYKYIQRTQQYYVVRIFYESQVLCILIAFGHFDITLIYCHQDIPPYLLLATLCIINWCCSHRTTFPSAMCSSIFPLISDSLFYFLIAFSIVHFVVTHFFFCTFVSLYSN